MFHPILKELTITDIEAERMEDFFTSELLPNLEILSLIDVRNETPLRIDNFKFLNRLTVKDAFDIQNEALL